MNREFHIDNMKCTGCVSAVQTALNGLSGCQEATVDLESATALVTGSVDTEQLVKVLTELGYPATPVD